jgi:hypothetical protein
MPIRTIVVVHTANFQHVPMSSPVTAHRPVSTSRIGALIKNPTTLQYAWTQQVSLGELLAAQTIPDR